MTLLSRLGWVGIAKESVQGALLAPTFYLPVTKSDFNIEYNQLKDESYRANDTNLQGLYQGVGQTTASMELTAYPDCIGYLLRVIGLDTVAAGVSTTLSSSTTVGATSISTAATIPAGSTIAIDTATNLEYVVTATPNGSGSYTIPITAPAGGLTKAQAPRNLAPARSPSSPPPPHPGGRRAPMDHRHHSARPATDRGARPGRDGMGGVLAPAPAPGHGPDRHDAPTGTVPRSRSRRHHVVHHSERCARLGQGHCRRASHPGRRKGQSADHRSGDLLHGRDLVVAPHRGPRLCTAAPASAPNPSTLASSGSDLMNTAR
ncbi:hypothetical protein ACFY97_04600 [Streptomyces klenkii]|uniref:hypothetical protein n=1 Tax=Streptomyces klenkii TaxID=1420899 RepID=UPI0036F14749